MNFELTNRQREYLGLDPIPEIWDKEMLKGDSRRQESVVYFDGDILKRHIIATDDVYKELQYNELTRDRKILLPKSGKGKEKKLTASVLEARQPTGVYFTADQFGDFLIGNHTSQTTFYSSAWENKRAKENKFAINNLVEDFISESPGSHSYEIEEFKKLVRRNVKYKEGDIFAFKLNRTEYGFGRILLNIGALRKKDILPQNHGLFYLMGTPLMVSIYAVTSENMHIDINMLSDKPTLPIDYMMDNVIFYGEYQIVGHKPLQEEDLDFPISYGRRLDRRVPNVFLQWGLIHIEKSIDEFDKYVFVKNSHLPAGHALRLLNNPYGYYGIGFTPHYGHQGDIKGTIKNNGKFQFSESAYYASEFDLRNPINKDVKIEILEAFGLNPLERYEENRGLTNTIKLTDLLRKKAEE